MSDPFVFKKIQAIKIENVNSIQEMNAISREVTQTITVK